MTIEIIELRKGDRFLATEPVSGSFGPASEVVILDLSLGGAKLSHPQPLRIGTRGKLTFKRGDISAAVQAVVVWSHLAPSGRGMSYISGLKYEAVEPAYAMALNALLRAGVLRKETDSLEKKRDRLIEREKLRNSQKRVIPTSGGVEGT